MSTTFDKRANTPDSVARLHHEAEILYRVAQPGVVEVAAYRFGPNRAELQLSKIEGVALGQHAFHSPTDVASFFAQLASTLAHIHEQGVAHTRLDLDHVLVAQHDGRPVICGFADAVVLADEWSGAPADDVYALGSMLREKLPPPLDLVRSRVAGNAEAESHDAVDISHLLSEIARSATDEDSSRRPSARRLALQLRDAAGPSPSVRSVRRAPRKAGRFFTTERLAAAFGILVTLVAVSLVLWLGRDEVSERKPVLSPLALATAPSCTPRDTAGSLVTDVDGDGCGDAVRLAAGVASVNAEQYTVGEPTDQLLLGRWGCEEPRTIALFRPSSGQVFVFDRWPATNATTTPRLIGAARGATAVRVRLGADGCDVIDTVDPRGRVTSFDPRQPQGAR